MKAATLASIMAVSLAGAACSERAPAETETPDATSEVAQPDKGQFNLRFPTGSAQPASSEASNQFNLRSPDSAGPDAGNGIRLPEGAVRDNALSDIPEIRTPDMALEESGQDAEDPDDEIIRLD